MALLFTSLFDQVAVAPAPDFVPPQLSRLLWWLRADRGVQAASGADAQDGDPVALWSNSGAAHDVVQSDTSRRPVLRTGGLNGHPFITCDADLAQCFEDLGFAQPAGFISVTPYTVFAVIDAVTRLDQTPALLGSPAHVGGKMGLHLRPDAGAQVHFFKPALRRGDNINPQMLMATCGRNAAGTTGAAYMYFWMRQNGTGLFDAAFELTNADPSAVASTEFLRCSGLPGGGYFDGHLYELLFYDGVLDDAETHAIETYLAGRYGIA